MTKTRGRRYLAFQLAVAQARAQAEIEFTGLLKKAARQAKGSAAWRYLSAMSPGHFPPSRNIAIGTMNNTLIAKIQRMEARAGTLPDPRLAPPGVIVEDPAALAGVQPQDPVTFEVVGYTPSRPDVLDLAPVRDVPLP
jgi:hypothetical protein